MTIANSGITLITTLASGCQVGEKKQKLDVNI